VRTRALAVAAALAAALPGCGSGSRSGTGPGCVDCTPPPPPPPPVDPVPANDWPQFRRDVEGTSRAGMALSAADAARLSEEWSRDVGRSAYAQAVVAGGLAFVTTADVGSAVALDVSTGEVRWRVDLDHPTHADCDGRDRRPGTWGSAAVLDGVVYVASADGGVYALDAATGERRWRAAVASPSPHGELIESSVLVSKALGKLWVGVASTAPCDQVPGRVAAVDLATGAVVQRALVPDGRRGGALWSTPSLDEGAGLLYLATGNAIGDPGTEPLAQAIVALDAVTLEPVGSWQNPTPLVNADFGASPTLLAAGGRKLVAAASKDGWLYVLDRANLAAGPVWKFQLAVTAGDGHGGDPLVGLGAIATAASANGLLYAAGGRTPDGEPGAIWALDPATGAVRWKHATRGPVLQPPAVNGEVLAVVSSFDDSGHAALELLDARTGAPLASFGAGALSLSPPTFGAGRVFWATEDAVVRSLALPR